MKFFALILLVFPLSANAFDKSAYPNAQGVYDDCKEAIKISEEADSKKFLRTACAARIQGIESMVYVMTAEVMESTPPESADSREGHIKAFLKDRIGMLCLFNDFHQSRFQGELPELHIAKEYVSFIDSHKNDPSFLQKADEIKTLHMLFMGRTPEECKKQIDGSE